MCRDVKQWCRECESCNRRKEQTPHPKAPLQTFLAARPLERVAIDLLGPLPLTGNGNKYIAVVSDYFTKWVEAYPLPNKNAETVARAFVNEFVCRFGAPEILHSDQGKEFEAQVFQEMCILLGINKTRTTPFHPQSDGMVERFNRTLLAMLSHYAGKNQRNWDNELPHVMLAYRTSQHDSTKHTPFSLLFGREARLPVDIQYGLPPGTAYSSDQEYLQQLRASLVQAHEETREQLQASHRRRKEYFDRGAKPVNFQIGDLVWVHQPTPRKGESPKLHRPWTGPYRVIKSLGMNTYRLRHCAFRHKRVVIHADRMKPCHSLPDPEQAVQEERARLRPGRPRKQPQEEPLLSYDSSAPQFVIQEVEGNVLHAPSRYALAHCVAADMRMGAGIALQFRARFGRVQELKRQNVRVGGTAMVRCEGRTVFYMVTKERSYHKPSYAAVRQCLFALRRKLLELEIDAVAMPMIACGLDGLQEHRIKDLIHEVFEDTNIEVCIYRKPEPRVESSPELRRPASRSNDFNLYLNSPDRTDTPIASRTFSWSGTPSLRNEIAMSDTTGSVSPVLEDHSDESVYGDAEGGREEPDVTENEEEDFIHPPPVGVAVETPDPALELSAGSFAKPDDAADNRGAAGITGFESVSDKSQMVPETGEGNVAGGLTAEGATATSSTAADSEFEMVIASKELEATGEPTRQVTTSPVREMMQPIDIPGSSRGAVRKLPSRAAKDEAMIRIRQLPGGSWN